MIRRTAAPFLAALALAAAGACERTAATPRAAAADPVPSTIFLAAAPPDARDVATVKKEAKPGDRVVVRGMVGGRENPFVEGRAVFTIVDLSLPACTDGCGTPWDYCCEPSSEILANAATVQVVGEDGSPIRAGVKGAGGLAPGSEVIVVGEVAQVEEGGSLVISTTGIYVAGA